MSPRLYIEAERLYNLSADSAILHNLKAEQLPELRLALVIIIIMAAALCALAWMLRHESAENRKLESVIDQMHKEDLHRLKFTEYGNHLRCLHCHQAILHNEPRVVGRGKIYCYKCAEALGMVVKSTPEMGQLRRLEQAGSPGKWMIEAVIEAGAESWEAATEAQKLVAIKRVNERSRA